MSETELSKNVWDLKDHGFDKNLSWVNYKKALSYQCSSKPCNRSLSEKVFIICADPDTLLNKKLN